VLLVVVVPVVLVRKMMWLGRVWRRRQMRLDDLGGGVKV
jgi:hypothetical protein